MPPPLPNAHSSWGTLHGPGFESEKVAFGAALLPLTTLESIDTVAPIDWPALPGIHTPPPAALPSVSFTPPVIVTRLIDTRNPAFAPPSRPTVTTGPPPRIMVAAADLPTMFTLVSIVKPPS